MKKGLKKFLAMVSIMSLTSGVGALKSFADANDSNPSNNSKPLFTSPKYVVYYQLKDSKQFTDEYQNYFDLVKIDSKDFYKQKTGLKDDALKGFEEVVDNFNTFYFGTDFNKIGTDLNKNGLSNVAVAGIAVGSAAAGAAIALVAERLVVHGDDSEN